MYFRLIFFLCINIYFTDIYAQISPPIIPADTVYYYKVEGNDTTKRFPLYRNLYIHDKQGHIREILIEKMQNKVWKYETRILFGYNAINRLQSYKKELWDSVGRDWLKYSRRTFAYNIRHLPISYLDEVWDNKINEYLKTAKTNFEYTQDNRAFEANYKKFKNNVWQDSLRQNIVYDTLKRIVGFEQKTAIKDGWKIDYVLEYKFQKGVLTESILKGQKSLRSFEILGKTSYLYDNQGNYLGEKKFKYDLYKQKYNETEGIRITFNSKKKYWLYTPYSLLQGKMLIENQRLIFPALEKTQNPLKDFYFKLIESQ